MASSRLFAERRAGRDRRLEARRFAVANVAPERRRVWERRRCAERRSTLERREQPARAGAMETPAEHLRNALQLLHQLAANHELEGGDAWGAESSNILAAAIHRARRALDLLERHRSPPRR